MSSPTPDLSTLMDFPATLTFRAVGHARAGLADQCGAAVQGTLGRLLAGIDEKPSANGRYSSVRVTVQVHSADEVRAVFVALKSVDGVLYLL
jgi:putative lipoic acid-binding regulatory protein